MPAILDKIADKLHLHHHENKEEGDAPKEPTSNTNATAATATTTTTTTTGTVFDKSKVTVLFVLGGPGAGSLLYPVWPMIRWSVRMTYSKFAPYRQRHAM
jgi:hypothetical protein